MTETEAPTSPTYKASVEQVGPCKKRVLIEVPEEAIRSALDQHYSNLRQEVVLPGFRRGRAPRLLLEKRLGKEAQEQVKLQLVSQTCDAAIKDNKLAVLNEPQVDVDHLELPATGPMRFQFDVEVWPEFELPPLEGIPVTKTVLTATDEQVDGQLDQMRRLHGTWRPRPDNQVSQVEDLILADVELKVEGAEQGERLDNLEVHVRPAGFVGQVPVKDLDKHLVGLKPGQGADFTTTVPKTYFNEQYRGKTVQVHLEVREVKYLQPADLDQAFLDRYGVDSEQALRDAVRQAVQAELDRQSREQMEDQIYRYLLEKADFELPLELVADQAASVLQRTYVRLLSRGWSTEDIEQRMEALRSSSEEEAKRQVKTFFVIDKVCERLGIEVTEEEVNGLIAQIALRRGTRPERLKEQMARDGTLAQFRLEVRQDKCIDKLLELAKVTEAKPKRTAKGNKSGSKD